MMASSSKVTKARNKMPASIQITSEQLLREAKERGFELSPHIPKQKIKIAEELSDYKFVKRKTFEDKIRLNPSTIGNWLKYAKFEEEMNEIERSRSIYERALALNYKNVTLWIKYTEMEMKHKHVNHARNIFNRAVTLMPTVDSFWLKYIYLESCLQNITNTRAIFERWIQWRTNEKAWLYYIEFEIKYREFDRARKIYESLIEIHPTVENFIRFSEFLKKTGTPTSIRNVFEKAVEFYGDYFDEKLYIAYAKFEEEQGECGTIRDMIRKRKKYKFEEEIKENPFCYDSWYSYLRIVESEGNVGATRELYERAIKNVPLVQEKTFWRRYIYLWINYALYEELEVKGVNRTREVYQACLQIIPHKMFTFGKVWLLAAQYEVRNKNIPAARKILGTAIGMCPKNKLFREYIEMEIRLREFDRCRILYQKFLEFNAGNCTTWIKFAELETSLFDFERARAIYNIAIQQPRLDSPEMVRKSYIDFEIGQKRFKHARQLHKSFLKFTQPIKVK